MPRIKEGFKGERAIVLPDFLKRDPLGRELHITDIGYYPHANFHYRERNAEEVNEFVLIYCVEGEGWFELDHQRYKITSNQFFILPKHQAHAYGSNATNPWTIYWIHFDGDKAAFFSAGFDRPRNITPEAHSRIKERLTLFEEIYSSISSGYNKNYMLYATTSLFHFLGSMKFIGEYRDCGSMNNSRKDVVQLAIHYMKENPQKFIGKKTFINSIPGAQLVDSDKDRLHEQLNQHRGQVVVELTEQEELDNKCLSDIKQSYAKLKVETAIDDYGSGYSNVNNLLRYMPKYVKIDRMLMEEIQNNPQKQHFVKDIIDFAHDNNILTLAEGIETSEELKEVIRLGVDLIQGYYTARPNPEPLEQIDPHIQIEILEYNKNRSSSMVRKDYIVDKPQSISLVQMALGKYTDIHIAQQAGKDLPIKLIGATGFQSNLRIWFEDGFHGTLILNTTHFSTEKCVPWLELGESVDLTIQLKGNTNLKMAGIRVPKSSTLRFVGEN